MANIPETPEWSPVVDEIDVTEKVLGGPDGAVNIQAKQLADRTGYLKQQVEAAGTLAQQADGKADQALSQIADIETAAGSATAAAAAAEQHRIAAESAAALAGQSRQNAAADAAQAYSNAGYAVQAAGTAQGKAAEASTSATVAQGSANLAVGARDVSIGARDAAIAARDVAVAAKSEAELIVANVDAVRDEAVAARDEAVAAQVEIRNLYYGPLVEDPATRPDGTAVHDGDEYHNTATGERMVYQSGAWSSVLGKLADDLASATDPAKGAGKVGFYDRLAPTYLQTVSDIINGGQVSLLRFIPRGMHVAVRENTVGDPLTDYVQDAMDALRGPGVVTAKSMRSLYCPAGTYPIGTVYIHEGLNIFGDWHIETTAKNATKFLQAETGDVFRLLGHEDATTGSPRQWWFGRIAQLAIFGDLNFASGFGINCRDNLDRAVALQDSSVFADITVRYTRQGGIRVPDGGLPFYFERLKFKDCEGPGVHMSGAFAAHQGVTLYGISSDRCSGGAIKLSNLDARGNVLIINPKSEAGINPHPTVNAERQRECIVIENCDNDSCITVVGGTHICATPDGSVFKKPGDFISITGGTTPHLDWSGVQVRVRTNDTGADPRIVSSDAGVAIPYRVRTGSLSNAERVHRTTGNAGRRVYGASDAYRAASVEAPGDQIAGTAPGRSYYETDVAADTGGWLEVASGGAFSLRTVSDAGSASKVFEAIRTGAVPVRLDYFTPVRPAVYTTTTLPAASTTTQNALAMVSNPPAGKGRVVYCNGATWKYVSDDSDVVS